MKSRLLLLALAVTLSASSGVRAEGTKPAAKPEKPETELEQTMDKMNKAWRELRKADKAGKLTPASADLAATVLAGAKHAVTLKPELEADIPAADRAKFQANYEAQMKKMIDTLGQLEAALRANDLAGASKLIAAAADIQKSGHKDFKKPDEK